ncbi:MAG: triose-phosphate isomerase [Puniceicoccales bacterium]|nr:triose-phosphate isomerase [Puniceicoccales bacterium]
MASNLHRPFIAGNWKMNKTPGEAVEFIGQLLVEIQPLEAATVLVCPPFTAIAAVSNRLEDTRMLLGAQNVHWERDGAFTGEISPPMLRDLFVTHVIIGHSERRTIFHETDEEIHKKILSAVSGGLMPILCVGENLSDREKGRHFTVVQTQLEAALKGIKEPVIIAYEPIWAIGTGQTATPELAQEMHAHIRKIVAQIADGPVAREVRILYGGSMKAANAKDLLMQPDIDGGLIGGASLSVQEFATIIKIASSIE